MDREDFYTEEENGEDLFDIIDSGSEDVSQEDYEEENSEEVEEDSPENLFDEDPENPSNPSPNEGKQEEDPRFAMIDYLYNSGYIDLKEDEDYTQYEGDDLDVFIENKMDEAVDSRINEALSQLPDVVRQLNEYALAGGDVTTFFSQIANYNSTGITENMNVEDPLNQEIIVRSALRSQGYAEDYINSQIEFLKTNNYLTSHATAYYNNYMQSKRAQLEQMAVTQKQAELERRKAVETSRRNITNYVMGRDAIGDIPLTARDKKELSDYMTYPAYELEDGTRISALQKDLYYDLIQNPELSMQIALLIKNRNEDGTLNLNFLEKRVRSRVTRDTRNSLSRPAKPTSTRNTYRY